MNNDNDPRVFFAAERTLLAWVRTGLAVLGLGFVVARFGLFLRLAGRAETNSTSHIGSTAIGVSLAVIGALALGVSAWRHWRFCQTLPAHDRPSKYSTSLPVWFAALLCIIGLALAILLLSHLSSPSNGKANGAGKATEGMSVE